MKYLATLIVTSLIIIAVLLPGSTLPSVHIIGLDKVVHFALFFVWSVAVRFDFSQNFKWLIGFIIGCTFAISTEVLQIFAEGRSFDGWDILFDAMGLSVGLRLGPFTLRLMTTWLKKNS